jgi:hypothetical protein
MVETETVDTGERRELFGRPACDTGHWQVSTGGGGRSAWSRDGRELFYLSLEGRLMTVAIEKAATFYLEHRKLSSRIATFHRKTDDRTTLPPTVNVF